MSRLSNRQRLQLEQRYAQLWTELTDRAIAVARTKDEQARAPQRDPPVSLSEASQQASSLKSLHPLSTNRTASLKPLSNKRKTDENNTINQSETPKAKHTTVPCQTRHPMHLRRHKNPITQLKLKIGLAQLSRKDKLTEQNRDRINTTHLNGDDNHE